MSTFKEGKVQIQYLEPAVEGEKQSYSYSTYSNLKELAADADVLVVAQSMIALQSKTSGIVKKTVETILN